MNVQNIKHVRPTIGVLAGWSTIEGSTPDPYHVAVISGMQSAARSRGCDLFISWGIRRVTTAIQFFPSWPVVSPKTDFVPVGPWNTDGLILFAPLTDQDRSRYIQQLISEGFPILFIATGEQGPQIAVNNQLGVRQAIGHLAAHGHHRIAFIAGSPADRGDSAVRLQAYSSAVEEYHLEMDPRLIVWGWHDYSAGYEAMQGLLAAGVKFTAVMASNDNSAMGAMHAIREAGLQIPHDIAITGFDNHPGAIAQVPPLSSVHVPLRLIGEQALIMMVEHLTTNVPLQSIHLPTRLILRRSCGCVPEVVSSAAEGTNWDKQGSPIEPRLQSVEEIQGQLVNEMLGVLPAEMRFPGGDRLARICSRLVEAFYLCLKQVSIAGFQPVLMETVDRLEFTSGDLDPWQGMISVLRREMPRLPLNWKSHKLRRLAENLLHQMRAAIGESAQREDKRNQYMREIAARGINSMTARLSAALSEQQVAQLLDEHLMDIGIRHARVLFCEAEGDDPVAWSVVLQSDPGHPRQRFPSRQFPPPGFYPPDELLNLLLLPLVFQNEVLGYVAFDAGDLVACAVIAKQLAVTIKVARLHETVTELSLKDSLTGLYNRRYFELFLRNEVARCRRFSRTIAVILMDVDKFKEYNDSFGHPAGDTALQQVAKCLTDSRRSSDIVAHLGGDEFVIVLPETDAIGALEVTRKVRSALAESSGLERPLSVSMGVAILGNSTADAELLLRQADDALYESKRKGRNRVSVFGAGEAVNESDVTPPSANAG